MPVPSAANVTRLLAAWRGGDGEALDELAPLIYAELHRIAHRYMRRELSATDEARLGDTP